MARLTDDMPAVMGPSDPFQTVCVMMYELGDVVKNLSRVRYLQALGAEEKLVHYREEEARVGLADLIVQCRVLAEQLGWQWSKLEADGLERLKERVLEAKSGQRSCAG